MSEQLTDLMCCARCEGNGQLYADGKRHWPSEHARAMDCPACGGTGRLCMSCGMPVDYDEYIATDACPHCNLLWDTSQKD